MGDCSWQWAVTLIGSGALIDWLIWRWVTREDGEP